MITANSGAFDEVSNKLDELLERRDLGHIQLTEWEETFLEDLAVAQELGRDFFTAGQAIKVREIYEEKLG